MQTPDTMLVDSYVYHHHVRGLTGCYFSHRDDQSQLTSLRLLDAGGFPLSSFVVMCMLSPLSTVVKYRYISATNDNHAFTIAFPCLLASLHSFVALAGVGGSDKPYECCRQAISMGTYASKGKGTKMGILR